MSAHEGSSWQERTEKARDVAADVARLKQGAGAEQRTADVPMTLAERTAALGKLLESKRKAYGGRNITNTESILATLYPEGIRPDQYRDALIMIRVFDKLSRIAARGNDGKDLGGESPWMDLAGYGVLGWERDEPR